MEENNIEKSTNILCKILGHNWRYKDYSNWIKENGSTKPVVGFVAGQTAPKGRKMGHAGAIIGGKYDTAIAKMEIMAKCGIHVVQSPAEIGSTMKRVLDMHE